MALRNLAPKVATLDTRSAKPAEHKANPFYLSKAWRDLVAAIILERGPYCEDSRHDSARTRGPGIRLFGDHIAELKDGGAPLERSNVLLRCGSCHTRKTIEARAARTARPAAPADRSA
jgi:5-methylcytosine-specific restriction protein A